MSNFIVLSSYTTRDTSVFHTLHSLLCFYISLTFRFFDYFIQQYPSPIITVFLYFAKFTRTATILFIKIMHYYWPPLNKHNHTLFNDYIIHKITIHYTKDIVAEVVYDSV